MKTLRMAAFAGLALLGTSAQAAQAVQQQACITPEEANAMFLSLAPGLVRSLVVACTPELPVNAYLRARGDALAERYVGPAAAARPLAAAAFGKISGQTVTPELFDVAAAAMSDELSVAKVKPEDCPKFDRVAALLDPLPPTNLAGLVTAIMEFAAAEDKQTPLDICRPAQG